MVAGGIAEGIPARVVPTVPSSDSSGSDKLYRLVARGAGLATLLVLALIGIFLFIQSWPAWRVMGLAFLTTRAFGNVTTHSHFGVLAALYWTMVIALIALVVAIPLALSTALFISEYAPAAVRRYLIALIDLLAAVPSIIYGLWGFFVLQSHMRGFDRWLSVHLAFIPFFRTTVPNYNASAMIAGVVVGLMVTPIIASISREVFSLAPPGEREGALALGASKWVMIRHVVLPFGRGGVIGAAMLGLGRALGETIAVSIIISQVPFIEDHILQAGAGSVAALIATQFGAGSLKTSALLAAGLVLFAVTLVVNTLASVVVNRSRSGKAVEL